MPKNLTSIVIFTFLSFPANADTTGVVIGGIDTVKARFSGCIVSRNKFWGTYQIDGKRLYGKDYVALYRNTGDPKLANRYRASVWLRYVIPYVVMFGAAGVGIANHWPSAYLLPGLGLGIAAGIVGSSLFVNTINDYNYWVAKKSLKTGMADQRQTIEIATQF